MSLSSVTVNVCGSPTWFVADGEMKIAASTQRFVAGLEFAPVPSVERVRERPETSTDVEAFTVDTPVVDEVSVIVQLPAAPTVRQKAGDVVNEPGPVFE